MSASTQAVSPAVAVPAARSEHRHKLLGAILGVAIAAGIRLLPTPQGLTPVGHSILAILALTVVFWVFEVLGNAVTSILMLGLFIVAGVRPDVALNAFSGLPFWILVVVLFYGYAMQSTGLARRLSFLFLTWFPCTYVGILGAFFAIGLVLSLGVPSMTVRTAILTPIAWALVQALGIEPKSKGCSLIMISTYEMAVIPGCATLLGSLWGPVMIGLFHQQGLALEWVPWAKAMFLPTIIWCVLLLVGNWLVLRPEQELTHGKEFARTELAKLGPMSLHEKIVTATVLLSIVFWATGAIHHMPTYIIGMFAMAVFAGSGILKERNFGVAVSWQLLLFLGAVFGLPEVIQHYKVSDWLAGYIIPMLKQVSGSVFLLAMALFVAMLLLRFADPTGFMIMTLLFIPVAAFMKGSPVSPIVLIAALLLAGHPFWALYENFWLALLHGMTNNESHTESARFKLANVYALVSIVALAIAVGYWRVIGLW